MSVFEPVCPREVAVTMPFTFFRLYFSCPEEQTAGQTYNDLQGGGVLSEPNS